MSSISIIEELVTLPVSLFLLDLLLDACTVKLFELTVAVRDR